ATKYWISRTVAGVVPCAQPQRTGRTALPVRIPPDADVERAGTPAQARFDMAAEHARPEQGAFGTGGLQQPLADRDVGAALGRDFHEAIGDVDGVAGRGDLLVALAAQPGRDHRPEMRTH